MNDMEMDPAQAQRFVLAVVRRIVRDSEDAADVAQDALVLAHRHRATFRGDSSYRTWLYRIATTTALGHLRKRHRSREHLTTGDEAVGAAAADPTPSPADLLDAQQEAAIVRRAVAGLVDKYRDVVVLRAAELTEVEIARRLGVTVANVKIRAYRGRQQLRAALGAA